MNKKITGYQSLHLKYCLKYLAWPKREPIMRFKLKQCLARRICPTSRHESYRRVVAVVVSLAMCLFLAQMASGKPPPVNLC